MPDIDPPRPACDTARPRAAVEISIVEPSDRISRLFARNAELNVEAAATQADSIALAARQIVGSLLGGGKILTCGNAASASDAQYFAALMQHRFERDRPGLPAIALTANGSVLSAIGEDAGFDAIFAHQIGALGHPGDVLLLLHAGGTAAASLRAVESAVDRQMTIIALTSQDAIAMAAHLRSGDVEIRTPSADPARVLENHRLVIHCLCDLIDFQLMGG